MKTLTKKEVRGISIINPDEVERNYYLRCIDYAIKNDYNHIQITGPIHDHVKGNIDGMIFYDKYAQFNDQKDVDYVNLCIDVVNEGLEKSHAAGIKTFMWHHELDLPNNFGEAFPEALNENGDIEVTHPILKDFLVNKINDFYKTYPKMDGIVITLHETKVPLLKLKNQKLDKIARVKYVVEVLYEASNALGKEIIVRPFASLEEDQLLMLKAFSEISKDIIVMDKWTKFDWSLSLPDNDFFKHITENNFVVETDIFGEYFGKGRLPIMFKEHIEHKYEHCEKFPNSGYVNRIDRNYQHPFGSVNEVNLVVMSAIMNGLNVEEEVAKFFEENYTGAAKEVRAIMEKTEENQKKIFYMDGYYFTQGSYFPEVNHAKNHFFFEIMREVCDIASDEWFIPVGWKRESIEKILNEKEEAATEAEALLKEVTALADKLEKEPYEKLLLKFKNLDYVAKLWKHLAFAIYNYVKYFETKDSQFENQMNVNLNAIDALNAKGRAELGKDYYNYAGAVGFGVLRDAEFGGDFAKSMRANFEAEKVAFAKIEKEEGLTDYIVCGSAIEGHKLQKEVNFSDTILINGEICRIPGSRRTDWALINAHGWFSYELKVKKNQNNKLIFTIGSSTNNLSVQITIGDQVHVIKKVIDGVADYEFDYFAKDDAVRIRVDRLDANSPYIYAIKAK